MNTIICPICKRKFKDIGSKHLKYAHNMSIIEFQTRYPDYPTMTEELRRTKDTSKHIDYESARKKISATKQSKNRKAYEANPKYCKLCGTLIPFEKRENMFCCQVHANTYISRHMTQETKDKISKGIKSQFQKHPEKFQKFLSSHTQNVKFYSKGEKELLGLLQSKFPEHHFTCGSLRKIGEGIYKSLDAYSDSLKLIIEYDGIYHFEEIYGNLEEVQYKDRLLEQWCVDNGWKIIRVNEITFQQHHDDVLSEIYTLVENCSSIPNITKLYWENY